jgi:Zn-dependent protease/predicted transcriptional regulator
MDRASGIRLGKILGIPIYLHPSWFIIFALITFSLGTQFTSQHPSWSPAQHWIVGVATAILFFGSVVFHEVSHSAVALRYRLPVLSITLFVFGGIARINAEPSSAKQEFNIAIAGPASSFFLAGVFYLVSKVVPGNEIIFATTTWLWQINFALAAFNLLPGFPLDGGRIFRSIVWGITKDFARATRYASGSGQLLAYLMIFGGIWQFVSGNRFGGLWLAFIGWFLLNAAQESYAQVAVQSVLAGVTAGDIMSKDVPTVGRDISLADYVHEVLRTGRRCHIVTGAGTPVGLITLHAARAIPRDEWATNSVQAAMLPIDKIHWAAPSDPVLKILERMQREDVNQMPVLDQGNIVGIIGRDSILGALQTRISASNLSGQSAGH